MFKTTFLTLALALGLASTLVTPVAAHDELSPLPVHQDARQARQELRQENRQERRDIAIEAIVNRVQTRFTRHEARLQNWIDRASEFVAKREAAGKDVTSSKAALTQAETSLKAAMIQGDEAVALLRAVSPEDWAAQKTDAIAAKEAVAKAQVAYAQVIKDVKEAVKEMRKTT